MSTSTRLRAVGYALAAVVLAVGASACGSDEPATTAAASADDGSTITLWTRAATETVSKQYADAYNATHQNKVEVTAYPNEEYPAKLASAAGAKALPDIFGSDVVFAPQYASQGLWLDITDRFDAFADKDNGVAGPRAQRHLGSRRSTPCRTPSTCRSCSTTRTSTSGPSLDPEKPPTTLNEFAEQARAIDALGRRGQRHLLRRQLRRLHRVHHLAVGVGQRRRRDERRRAPTSTIDSKEMADVFALYRTLYDEGVAAPASKDEAGPTWLAALQSGNIGIAPGPSVWLGLIEEKGIKMGVAPITGLTGGESTFVGGDTIGISATSDQGRPGLGLPRVDDVRRGPGRGDRQEQGRADPHRPRVQQVLLGRPPDRDHQQPGGQGQDAVREELQRHLQRPAEPVDHHLPRCPLR